MSRYGVHSARWINSLTRGRDGYNFEIIIFELIYRIDILKNSYEIVLWRMPKHQFHDKSTLVQVMAWCRQATSHYLSQWWPRSLSPYGVTRPQWVKATPFVGIKIIITGMSIVDKDSMVVLKVPHQIKICTYDRLEYVLTFMIYP